MSPTSTPSPFHDKPMFQRWGEEDHKFPITTDTGTHQVTVRIAWARPETVCKDGTNRGATPYGRHAHKNLGLSIVRADRELRSEEHKSELQSLKRNSYADFCMKKKKNSKNTNIQHMKN